MSTYLTPVEFCNLNISDVFYKDGDKFTKISNDQGESEDGSVSDFEWDDEVYE